MSLFPAFAQENQTERFWTPVADEVFLQEVSHKIQTDQPITGIGVYQKECYGIIQSKIHQLKDNKFKEVQNSPSQISRLIPIQGELWALGNEGIYKLGSNAWEKVDNRNYVDLSFHDGKLYAATSEEIFKLENNKFVSIKPEGGYYNSDITMLMEDGTQLHAEPVKLGPITRFQSYAGTLHILRSGELVQFDGKIVNTDFIDWGKLPSKTTRDLQSFGSRLYVSTDRGLAELQGASLKTIQGKDGLPVENTTSLTRGFANDLWIGTERGAVRMLKGEWQYFGASHWLPSNKVNDIAVADKKVFIATDGGLGIIEYQEYTLQKKAEFYERHIEEWGQKRLGFIQTLFLKDGEWTREVSDNDGDHTASYLAAMCYKYKVTGDEEARKKAVESFKAMIWLERITPIDGLVARSIYSVEGDKSGLAKHGSGGLPAKWNKTEDGKWYWKGDTSSDEIIAHFYSVSIFHDLVAEGHEKELAKEHLTRIASYIHDNGFLIIDMDGKPTRWGRWDPDYLLTPYGYSDRGLNGLEALAFMQTAYSVSGDEKFKKGYQQLVDWGYLNNTLRQKNTFPPSTLAPWDDQLAFEAYYTILRYTTDPKYKSFLLRSLERTFEVKRMEHVPWFNFAYGAYTNNDFDNEHCVKHLQAWTLDCVEHSFQNSHRDDLFVEVGFTSYEGGLKTISPRESSVMRGSRYATVLDGSLGGRRVMEPTGYLRDYWMGRYHGFIEAPTVTDKALLTVEPRNQKFGAAPYQGPARPEF
ncbi:hypothetical protein B0E43_13790 [Algoriphagus sp. A40]|nr:hypothetical protein B0E43_13790 [Algoriphagus sp. A40]